ncbi:hypothetical protein LLH23_11700 [bacterium]|nr:hypothetical protein [bacterium]
MRHAWTLLLMLPALMAPVCAQEAKMDPRIAYAPDIVGIDRLFMIAIKAPPGATPIAVQVPTQVKLLDQTRMPTTADMRRYYFRSQQPGKDIKIVFAHPDGPLTVTIEVWSLDDLHAFRKLKNVQLPRRWPLGETLPELKQQQTLTTQAQKDAARKAGGGADGWLKTPDDDIWNMQPDSTIPRWHWVNVQYGCPTHGQQIYEKRAYYPWLKDGTHPYKWKIECPVGHELYPSNDFGKDDFTSGPFPDDGIGGGYVAPDGKHYGFIAEICQLYCHRMLSVAPACAQAYLGTGDIKYVHKALVALSRVAVEHAYLATMTQHRHRNRASQVERLGQGRFDEGPILGATGLTVYPIDQPSYQISHAEAYDKIFDAIDKDPDIVPFLQKKGIAVKTGEDVRRFIEENAMATWMQGAMDGATSSNEPYSQWGLVKMAEMLNYQRGNEFFDWLYNGAGHMRIFVPNGYFRDGAPYESTNGYNGMHVVALGPIIDSIEHLKELRPEVYPDEKYPSLSKSRRYRSVFDFCMDTVIIDRTCPMIGDSGSHPKFDKLSEINWHDASDAAFEHAYRLFKTPKFAWALTHKHGWKPSLDFPYTREQIEKEAAKWPDDWNDASSLHDGYGIAILRDGKGEDKRALWMMYGRARGHVQDNILDIGLASHKGVVLQHMGYPRNWGYWEYSWSSHEVCRQFPYLNLVAQAQLFADAGVAQVCEARAHAHNEYADDGTQTPDPQDYWQRRMLAMVNVSPDQSYCVDLYRILGGKDHWWAFHCQEGDFQSTGLNLTRQATGTLAGPDVKYGDADWMKANGCNYGGYGWGGLNFVFPHLYNVEKATSDGGWSANWKLATGEGLQFRLNVVSSPGMEVNLTDGTSPAGGKPYEMKWLMLHKQAEEPAKSEVFTIMESYRDAPAVQSVAKLPLSGEEEAGFAPAGCVVNLGARTDYLMAATDPKVVRTAPGDLKFAGRFGLYAEENGQPVAISLVGGTEISKGKFGLKIDQPEFRGKIVKVDRKREVATVAPAPPVVNAIVGQYVFLVSGGRRQAYKVTAAKAVPAGAELTLDMDSRIGTGQVSGTADFMVKTETPFTLQRWAYYEGARLVNAKGDAEYRINEIRGGVGAFIDRETHKDATAAKLAEQFPQGSWFEVYDYGVGDEVVWPYAVSVKRVGPGAYQVKSPVPVVLNLPQ